MTCATGKMQFRSKAIAKHWLRRHKGAQGLRAKHAYECPVCGQWHLTSSTATAGAPGACDRCGVPIVWMSLDGRLVPLDPVEVTPQRRALPVYVLAVATGEGERLRRGRAAREDVCVALAERGSTFHLCHFDTCRERVAFRKAAAA